MNIVLRKHNIKHTDDGSIVINWPPFTLTLTSEVGEMLWHWLNKASLSNATPDHVIGMAGPIKCWCGETHSLKAQHDAKTT